MQKKLFLVSFAKFAACLIADDLGVLIFQGRLRVANSCFLVSASLEYDFHSRQNSCETSTRISLWRLTWAAWMPSQVSQLKSPQRLHRAVKKWSRDYLSSSQPAVQSLSRWPLAMEAPRDPRLLRACAAAARNSEFAAPCRHSWAEQNSCRPETVSSAHQPSENTVCDCFPCLSAAFDCWYWPSGTMDALFEVLECSICKVNAVMKTMENENKNKNKNTKGKGRS